MWVIINKDKTMAVGTFDDERSARAWLRKRPGVNGTIVPMIISQEFDFFVDPLTGKSRKFSSTNTPREEVK